MKPFFVILVTVLISAATAYGTVKLASDAGSTKQESVYDRVMRTQTIRCGYAPWPALIDKDPNTGKLSGTFVDYLEAIGKATGLKIEWTAELGFGDFIAALDNNRIDAMCSGTWTNAKRGMAVQFINPISYQGVVAWVRKGDRRFDNNLEAINSAKVKVSAVDGASSQEIPQTFYPKAKLVSLPQLSDSSQLLLNVVTGKADVAFTDQHTVGEFSENNPGKLRAVVAPYPVKLFGNPIAIKMGEPALAALLNNATMELLNTGVIEQILKKHEKYPGTFYRAAVPFKQ